MDLFSFFKKHKKIWGIVIGLCVLIYGIFIFFADISNNQIYYINKDSTDVLDIFPQKEIVQMIEMDDTVEEIQFRFATYTNTYSNSQEKIYINIENDNDYFVQKEIDISQLTDNEFVTINLQNNPLKAGETYQIMIGRAGIFDRQTHVAIYYNQQVDNASLYLDGENISGSLTVGIRYSFADIYIYYGIVLLFMVAFLIVTYLTLYIKHICIEKNFIIYATMLGILFMFIIPPFTNFDDVTHYASNYKYANIILNDGIVEESDEELTNMGYGKTGNVLKMREGDLPISYVGNYETSSPTVQSYKAIIHNLFSTDHSKADTLVEYANAGLPYQSIPIWSGMVIARIIGLGQIPMIMLCRILSLVVYIIIMYFAIRIIPFGKLIVFIIALLPMSLSLVVSFSYDTFYIEIATLLIALTLKMAYSSSMISAKQIIGVFILIALLVPHKLVYTPLALLPIIIPKEKLAVKNRDKLLCRKTIFLVGIFFVTLLSLGIYFYFCLLNPFMGRETYSEYGIGPWNNKVYTAQILLSNIIEAIRLYADSLIYNLGYTILHSFSWIQHYNIPLTFMLTFAVIAIFISFSDRNFGLQTIRAKHICICVGIAFCSFSLCIAAAMQWTTLDNLVVMGLHGRYFIPIYPLAFILVRQFNKVKVSKNSYKYLIFAFNIVSVLLLIYMFRFAMENFSQVSLYNIC